MQIPLMMSGWNIFVKEVLNLINWIYLQMELKKSIMNFKCWSMVATIDLSRLEPYDGKLSRTVLRGGMFSNAHLLPDYAQIMEMLYPELRKVPMAVGGHEELRHGIILAKNLEAKKYGIKTADTLREAKDKCPAIVIIPPQYEKFIYYTHFSFLYTIYNP